MTPISTIGYTLNSEGFLQLKKKKNSEFVWFGG